MAARYEVILKDNTGTIVVRFDDFQNLRYTKRVNDIHSWAIQLNQNHPAVSLFELDGQIEVYRSDVQNGIAKYLDFEGIFRTPVNQLFENGNEIFTAYGSGYNEFLLRRQIWYFSGHVDMLINNDPAETAMKTFVNLNLGPSADAGPNQARNGVAETGTAVMTGLSIEADGADGDLWSGSRAWRSLFLVLQEIAEDTETFFDIVGVGDALYEFRFYENQRGEDRSVTGLDSVTGLNGAGNIPVIFSVPLGNIQSMAHSVNRSDEVTVMVVLGQGLGEGRDTSFVQDAVAKADSPINRREGTFNSSEQSGPDFYSPIANRELNRRAKKTNFSFSPLAQSSVLLGRDYNWGDLITARYLDEEFNLFIAEMSVMVAGASELINFQIKDTI